MNVFLRTFLNGLVITTILGNANALTIAALVAYSLPAVAATEQDARLKSLQQKHDLQNPYRDTRRDNRSYEVIPRGSKDMTDELTQAINNAQGRSKVLTITPNTSATAEEGVKAARVIGKTVTMPGMDPTSNQTQLQLSSKGTVELYRDPETGQLSYRQRDDLDGSEMQSVSMAQSEVFSTEIEHSRTDWEGEGAYGDEDALFEAGRGANARLRDSSNQTGEGVAYRTLLQGAERGAQAEEPAAVLNPSFQALGAVDSTGGGFLTACSTQTVSNSSSLYKEQLEQRFCQRMATENPFQCEVEREYNSPKLVANYSGDVSIVSCGLDCVEVTMNPGKKNQDIYQGGSCTVFTESGEIAFNAALQVDRVTLLDSSFDDHGVININGTTAWSVIDGVYGASSTWRGSCERKQNFESTTHQGKLDEVIKQKFAEHNGKINLDMLTRVSGGGGGYIKFRVYLSDPNGPLGFTYQQFPEGCYDQLTAADRQQKPLTGMRPVDTDPQTGELIGGHCTFDGYSATDIHTDNLPQDVIDGFAPWYSGDTGKVTWRVNLDGYTCDPFGGEKHCVAVELQDGSVAQVCKTWEELQQSGGTCGPYEARSECEVIATECTDGFSDLNWDYCFNETVTYECDEGYNVGFEYDTTSSSCDSMLPCAGGDCDWGEKERNSRFVEAAAMGNVMQQIPGETTCDVPGDVSTCRVFEGDRQYCSWATASDWGNDCCEAPDGIDFLDYLNMTQLMLKFENQQLGGVYSTPVKETIDGAWTAVSDTVTNSNAWQSVSSYFTSATETITGNVATSVPASAGADAAVATAGEAGFGPMAQWVSQQIYDALPAELGNMIFTTTAAETGGNNVVQGFSPAVEGAVNFIGTVMFWYSMYQLAQLIGSLLTACDDTDNDTALKLEMRQCYAVDDNYCGKKSLGLCIMKRQDYCCYPSMLSRIIMEQAHVLLNKDMSECQGLNHEELSTLDFSRIDLSEWIATMVEANLIPEASPESLSGSGRMDNSTLRETPAERTRGRTEGAAEGARRNREAVKAPLDCSVYPRPPVCDFGFDLTDGKQD
ncbi:conjugal transfer protein TraN [Pseudoalteromonas rubra]|uniref:Conjugal transfer protein TraN n=1 Tax=Pseudoalteromonas rubra TaxID=43658 RepID=A0A0U3GST4_9GAMM|nr:conjugal transfer protein TraN [Pseudoalteromonas rubra]ALU46123.1 hypothetical protein AT705_24485 [Pseudoalteromonas rubra]